MKWYVREGDEDVVEDENGLNVAFPHGDDFAERKRRAKLIAAAPEMLEALRLLIDQIENGEDEIWVLNKARAAIARVTGGKQ